MAATGLALFWPAMSGAEPCTLCTSKILVGSAVGQKELVGRERGVGCDVRLAHYKCVARVHRWDYPERTDQGGCCVTLRR